jgi:hypothetical protein
MLSAISYQLSAFLQSFSISCHPAARLLSAILLSSAHFVVVVAPDGVM